MNTTKAIAKRYTVSVETVLKWIKAGELKAVNVSRSARSGKPRYRVSDAALAEFEQARSAAVPTPKPARRRPAPEGTIRFY